MEIYVTGSRTSNARRKENISCKRTVKVLAELASLHI
jgi:hypothetical protein